MIPISIDDNTLVAIANRQPLGMQGEVIRVPVLEAGGELPTFPNAGGAMDLNNLLMRTILPALIRCVLCGMSENEHENANHDFERDKSLPVWRGRHAFRRGLATNLYRLGVPEKTIQAILRLANVSTTQTCYIKAAPEDARAAMNKLELALDSNQPVKSTEFHLNNPAQPLTIH